MNRRQWIALAATAWLAPWAMAAPETVGKTYAPGPFDALTLAGSATVQFRQGERDEVFIEGDEAVQRNVALELIGTELTVRTQSKLRLPWQKPDPIRMHVVMRELKLLQLAGAVDFIAGESVHAKSLRVSISGAGLARFDRLHAEYLRFEVSGAGDGYFSGSTDELSVEITGRSDYDGVDLRSRAARVAVSGIGKARVWAVESLQASVSGVGRIDYWGKPKLDRRASGLGSYRSRGPKPTPAPTPTPAP